MSLTDQLLDTVLHWMDASIIRQAAGEVARECRTAVWHHIANATQGMSVAQIRGYARAVAPQFIGTEVDVVLRRRRAGLHLRTEVIAAAVEELIELVAADAVYAQSLRPLTAAA
jgi:hypothetical protein